MQAGEHAAHHPHSTHHFENVLAEVHVRGVSAAPALVAVVVRVHTRAAVCTKKQANCQAGRAGRHKAHVGLE